MHALFVTFFLVFGLSRSAELPLKVDTHFSSSSSLSFACFLVVLRLVRLSVTYFSCLLRFFEGPLASFLSVRFLLLMCIANFCQRIFSADFLTHKGQASELGKSATAVCFSPFSYRHRFSPFSTVLVPVFWGWIYQRNVKAAIYYTRENNFRFYYIQQNVDLEIVDQGSRMLCEWHPDKGVHLVYQGNLF